MEMISPNLYKEINKGKSLTELLSLKEKLQNDIEKLSQEDTSNLPFTSDTRLPMTKEYLGVISSLIEEKKNQKRNEISDNSLKIKCPFCNSEISIDADIPKNIKSLDTMCPNCKSFVKYSNPNYEETNSKELKDIMDTIFNKLTGDNTKDFKYLNRKADEYKNHPLSKEITKEIGRKLYDLLPQESKNQFEDAYNQDITNINKMLKEVETYIFGNNKNLDKAKNILLDFIKKSLSYDNDLTTEYYNFNGIIDFLLYNKITKTNKNIKWIDIPFVTVYSYLAYIYNEEKNYDEALKMIEKTIRWNPMSLSPLFEKCETYKMQNKLEEFKNNTLVLYDKIYNANDLAHYYRNLGYYYIEMNKLDLAYALYTASIQFERNINAYREMMYINQKLNRDKYEMSAAETIKLLTENNIVFGPKKENLNRLIEIYSNEKELIKNSNIEMQLANRIYCLTKDKKFAPFIKMVDNKVGCSITIPRNWNPVKEEIRKQKFGSRNMFAIYTNHNSLFQANYDGKCSKEQFEKAYQLNIDNIINSENSNVKLLGEETLTLKLQQGLKHFKQALFDITTYDKTIRIIHNFTLINDMLVDFSIDLDEKIDYFDKEKFNNQKNMKDIVNILSSILELKNEKPKNLNDIKDDTRNKTYNNLIESTNKQLEEINNDFKNNKKIDKIFVFVNSIFENTEENNLFWLNSSKEVLIYILVKLLEENNEIKYDDIINILNDKNEFIEFCKNATTTINNNNLIKIIDHINHSNEKMIESYYSIIKRNVKILNSKEELVTHNIKFNDESNFKFSISKKLGPLTHPDNTSYRIGNNITIMNVKCNSEELLKNTADAWLRASAKKNNQIILDNLDTEYFLNNNQLKVIEKVATKDNKNRYYKFVYNNQIMLIFAYNNKNLSKMIDSAIISLKVVKDQLKIERDPFENPNIKNEF